MVVGVVKLGEKPRALQLSYSNCRIVRMAIRAGDPTKWFVRLSNPSLGTRVYTTLVFERMPSLPVQRASVRYRIAHNRPGETVNQRAIRIAYQRSLRLTASGPSTRISGFTIRRRVKWIILSQELGRFPVPTHPIQRTA